MSESQAVLVVDDEPTPQLSNVVLRVKDPIAAVGVMIAKVSERGDVAALEKLMDLQERVTEREDRMAFWTSFHAFSAELTPAPENGKAEYPNGLKYSFPKLNDIATHTTPLLAKHGLVYHHTRETLSSGQNGMPIVIRVNCQLTHVRGFSIETDFVTEIEYGAKGLSKAQCVAKAETYAKRRSLMAVLGLASADKGDTDGNSPEGTEPPAPRTVQQPQAKSSGNSNAREKVILDLLAACDKAGLQEAEVAKAIGLLSLRDIERGDVTPAWDKIKEWSAT